MEDEKENLNAVATPTDTALDKPAAVQNESKADSTVNAQCAEIMSRLMGNVQLNLDMQNAAIQELQRMADETGRDDIRNAIQEIKDLVLGDELEHLGALKSWYGFFMGIEPENPFDESADDTDDDWTDDEDVVFDLEDESQGE